MNKNKGAACKYEGSHHSDKAPPKYPSSPPKDVLMAWSDSNESAYSQPSPPDSPEGPSVQPGQREQERSPLVRENVVPVPPSDASVTMKAPGVTECTLPPTAFPLTVHPSIHFQTIPRPLRIPLSLIPPERLQVSWVAGSEMDMKLYVFSRRPREYSLAGGLKARYLAAA